MPTDLINSIRQRLEHTARRFNTPIVRRIALVIAGVFLAVGLVISIAANPRLLMELNYQPIIACALVAAPLALLASTIEYMVSARLAGAHIPFPVALQTTIIGTAANLLPIPGAAMVRVAGIKAAGSTMAQGAASITFAAALWPAIAGLVAGVAMVALDHLIAGLFVAFGSVVLLTGAMAVATIHFGDLGLAMAQAGVKSMQVVIEITRLSLCFMALHQSGDLLTSCVLNISNVFGSIVSIVPAGLGVREGVAVALAPLVSVSATLVFLAVAIDRILGLLVVTPFAFLLALRRSDRTIS